MRRALAALLSATIAGGCADEKIVRIARERARTEPAPFEQADPTMAEALPARPQPDPAPDSEPELEWDPDSLHRLRELNDEIDALSAQEDVLTPEEFAEKCHYLKICKQLAFGMLPSHRVRRVEGTTVEMAGYMQAAVGDRIDLTRGRDIVGRLTVTRVSEGQVKGALDTAWTGTLGLPVVGDVAWTRADLEPFRNSAYSRGLRHRVPRDLPDGVVLSIEHTRGGMFVALSVGTKDNVRVGDEYHLSRGGKYVGRLTLVRVAKDSAYGKMDEQWTGTAFPPRKNDKARTE